MALAARRQWLIEQQLADGERSAFRYRDGAIDSLRQRELQEAGERFRNVGKLETAFTMSVGIEKRELPAH